MQIDNDNKRKEEEEAKSCDEIRDYLFAVANNIPDKKRAVELVRLNEIVDKLERPKTHKENRIQHRKKKKAKNISALIEHSHLPVWLRGEYANLYLIDTFYRYFAAQINDRHETRNCPSDSQIKNCESFFCVLVVN